MAKNKGQTCILCKTFKSHRSFRNGAKKCDACSNPIERDHDFLALKDIWTNQKLQKTHWPATPGLVKKGHTYD